MMGKATVTRAQLARMIDDTLLEPEATAADVTRIAEEAARLDVHAICISPSRLPLAPGVLAPGTALAAVAGFPSGAHPPAVKVAEAAAAVAAGASEIDMVIDLGAAMENRWANVTAEVAAVRAAVGPSVVLKAIIETALIGPDRIAPASQAAEAGGRSDSRRGRRPPENQGVRGNPDRGRSAGDDRGRRHPDRHLTYRGHPERSTR
jgi:deoxyribose-phosphate aldolase